MAENFGLPPGFVVDQAPASNFAPPPGFVVDQPKAAPAPGTLEALGRGALQGVSFGFSDEITGALESLFSDKTYGQARDEARKANAAAQEAHPWAYTGGELAGGLAPGIASAGLGLAGSAVAEGSNAARALGGAAKAAELVGGVAPKGAGLWSAAAHAAVPGALTGLGSSEASDASGLTSDALKGGLYGAITGGALHALGSKAAAKAGPTYEENLNQDVFGGARPKDRKLAFAVQEANPKEFREMAYGDDFAQVQKLARSGDTEGAHQAAETFVRKASENRLENYRLASGAGGDTPIQATVRVGDVVSRFEKEAAAAASTEGRAGESKVLKTMADDIRSKWETVPRDTIAEGKLAPAHRDALEALKAHLPDHYEVTKKDVQQAAMKAAGVGTYGEVPHDFHQAIENLNFSFNPEAKVDLLRMRSAATAAQTHAKETLGSIAETEHYRIAAAADKVTNQALEKSLDEAAKMSPAAKAAVERIRHDDKLISMGLSARDALEMKLNKEATGKVRTLGEKFGDAVGGLSKMGGIAELAHGDPVTGGALLAAPYVLKGASAGIRRGNDMLARIVYAAEVDKNPWAIAKLAAFRATPAGAARLASMRSPRAEAPLPMAQMMAQAQQSAPAAPAQAPAPEEEE